MQNHNTNEYNDLYMTGKTENEKIFSVLNDASKLYGANELSVDISGDGMIDINVMESHCDMQPYFSAVARYDKCNIKELITELDRRGVAHLL